MLRSVLLVVGSGVLLLGGVLCALHVLVPGLQLLIAGVIFVGAVAFERWRYTGRASASERGWEDTQERFEDPETGRVMRVQFHRQSGTRRYVESSDSRAHEAP